MLIATTRFKHQDIRLIFAPKVYVDLGCISKACGSIKGSHFREQPAFEETQLITPVGTFYCVSLDQLKPWFQSRKASSCAAPAIFRELRAELPEFLLSHLQQADATSLTGALFELRSSVIRAVEAVSRAIDQSFSRLAPLLSLT